MTNTTETMTLNRKVKMIKKGNKRNPSQKNTAQIRSVNNPIQNAFIVTPLGFFGAGI